MSRVDEENASLAADAEPGVQADQQLIDRGWLRIGAGCLIAGQAMVFSFAMNLSEVEGPAYWVVHGLLIVAALGALAFLGGDLMRSAWTALGARRISVDLLFLVTLCGALGGSLVSTFTRTGSVYYEVVAVLIVVHTTGKMLGARSRLAALRAAGQTRERFEWCNRMRNAECGVQNEENMERIRVAELREGDVVRVGPGGAISVDGVIVSGRGFVQETSMTGEWRPVSRGAGERVLAGTFSVDGFFDIAADVWPGKGGAGGRRLDGILSAVERARLAPSVLQAQADTLVAWFLPLVACVSAGTFFGWWWLGSGGWAQALFNAMAVLLVACPCAMGLATPAAIWGGLARLAGFGLVARTGDFLDALARVDFVCFDKTGTLSEENVRVREWRVETAFLGREAWLRACVAELEQGVAHPVAAALRGSAGPDARVQASERRVVAGRGVTGIFDGVRVAAGTREIQEGANAQSPEPEDGKCVFVFVDGALAATVELEEKWRDGLEETVSQLRALGIEGEVLTGDAQGARAGLPMPVRAGITPAEKAARVEELEREGRCVLFMGDGVNDAAAMSAAQVSIAMGGGAELAKASAMAVFAGAGLEFLPRAVRVARAARKSVHYNLRFAACYNATGMALAACGLLHPVVAALLMVGSSVIVSISAVRGTRDKVTAT